MRRNRMDIDGALDEMEAQIAGLEAEIVEKDHEMENLANKLDEYDGLDIHSDCMKHGCMCSIATVNNGVLGGLIEAISAAAEAANNAKTELGFDDNAYVAIPKDLWREVVLYAQSPIATGATAVWARSLMPKAESPE